jgi:hypothetical protein
MSSADKLNKQTKTLADFTDVLKDSPNFNGDSVERQLTYEDFADLLDQFISEISQARRKDVPVLSDYAVSRAGIYEDVDYLIEKYKAYENT